jgi:hypothetical protein
MDEDVVNKLLEEIKVIKERLQAIEKEQRLIREDILSGDPKERMQKRILNKPPQGRDEIKEKIDKEIKIEI